MIRSSAVTRLLRAPAALTVLGDTLAGAAAAGRPLRGRRLVLPVSSAALYWAGMALNDYADRAVDARERPERPIPSGQISPGQALGVAGGLTVGGLALAAAGGGRDALRVATALAGTIWAYDWWLKHTPAGPVGMAACRGLDVLLGAGWPARHRAPAVLASAGVLAVHTLGVTALSRGEVHGGSAATGIAAAACSALAGISAPRGPARSRGHRAAAALASVAFTALVVPRQLAAARQPSARAVREATVAGIHGMVPLQCALAARRGPLRGVALVAVAFPLARRLGRRVSPT